MEYKELMKLMLLEIDSRNELEDFPVNPNLEVLGEQKIISMLYDAVNSGYLSHHSKQQDLVTNFYGGGFLLHQTAYVTLQGRDFIEGKSPESSVSNQTFHINSVTNSNIGNHGTINNHGLTVSDLLKIIDKDISDPTDKKEAEELVNVISNEPIKPNLLKRFNTLLEKYPKVADTTGKILLTLATGGLIQ